MSTIKTTRWTGTLGALAILFTANIAAAPAANAGLKLCEREWAAPADILKQLSETENLPEVHRSQYYVAYQDPKTQTMWTFTLKGIPSHPAVVCRQPIKEGDKLKLHMDVNCDGDERACDALVKDFRRLNSEMAKAMNQRK